MPFWPNMTPVGEVDRVFPAAPLAIPVATTVQDVLEPAMPRAMEERTDRCTAVGAAGIGGIEASCSRDVKAVRPGER